MEILVSLIIVPARQVSFQAVFLLVLLTFYVGVELLTKVASKEYGKFGIRVNTVLPGFIETPMTDAVPEKLKAKFVSLIPIGRFGQPEGEWIKSLITLITAFFVEVAEVIAFLASDKSSYINGTSIEVAGGF